MTCPQVNFGVNLIPLLLQLLVYNHLVGHVSKLPAQLHHILQRVWRSEFPTTTKIMHSLIRPSCTMVHYYDSILETSDMSDLPNVTVVTPAAGPTAGLQVVTVTGNNLVKLQVNSLTPTLAFTCKFGSMFESYYNDIDICRYFQREHSWSDDNSYVDKSDASVMYNTCSSSWNCSYLCIS